MVSVGQIAECATAISPDLMGQAVYERFRAEPDLMVIAIVDEAAAPVGLIERHQFSLRMASTYGRSLYAGRPIEAIMDRGALVVDEATSVSVLAEGSLVSRPADLLKGIIVTSGGRYRGVVTITALLQSITDESRQHAVRLEEAAKGLSMAKAEAQSANEMLHEALNAMGEGVAIFDRNSDFLLWNDKYAETHRVGGTVLRRGAPFEEVVRHGVGIGLYDEARGREETWIANRLARRTGLQARSIEEQELAGGRFLRVEDTRLPSGGIISVAVDITEIKQRSASFKFLFKHNPVPLAVFERHSLRFLAVNDSACRQYGYASEAFAEMNLLALIPPDHRAEAAASLEQDALEGGRQAARTWENCTASGKRLIVRPYMRPIVYEGKNAILVAAPDITAQQMAERALTDALVQAEGANKAKSEFLANMSHEIRTPLNGVLGVVSVLAQTNLSTKQRGMVDIVTNSARTLQVLLDDLLDISKIESGLMEIHPQPMAPAELGAQIANLFRHTARDKGLQFELVMDEGAYRPLLADRTRLAQILTNLTSNAVKFTERGTVKVSIETEERGDQRCLLRLSVSDTGIGISPAGRERLFERFSQADGSITRRFGGTGLGLAISHQLVQLMDGAITVVSQEGEGSTFTVELSFPSVDIAEDAPAAEPPAPDAVSADEPMEARLRVLLVEDHPVNRQVVELIIGDAVDLVMAENGAEGVAAEAVQTFDIILMDMQMPVMDGLTAIRHIRARERAAGAAPTPIIVLTANVLGEHIQACLDAGADRHLSKPISAPALIAAIEDTLAATDTAAPATRAA